MMLEGNANYPGTMRRCAAEVGDRTWETQCVRTGAQDVLTNAVAARGTGRIVESASLKMYRSCTIVPECRTGKQKMYQLGTCVLI